MVDTAVAVDVVRAAMCEYRKSFPDKEKTTVSDQVLILSTLEALEARGMVVVDRERFERLMGAAKQAQRLQAILRTRFSHLDEFGIPLIPGDLDPIP